MNRRRRARSRLPTAADRASGRGCTRNERRICRERDRGVSPIRLDQASSPSAAPVRWSGLDYEDVAPNVRVRGSSPAAVTVATVSRPLASYS